jgi:hypothetical protein
MSPVLVLFALVSVAVMAYRAGYVRGQDELPRQGQPGRGRVFRTSALASSGGLGCLRVRRAAELSVPGPRVSVCQALGMGCVVGGVGALVRPLHWSDLARRVVLAALPSGPSTLAAETNRDPESTRRARQ